MFQRLTFEDRKKLELEDMMGDGSGDSHALDVKQH